MTPDELAYQDELQRSGLAIPLALDEAFKPSLNALLELMGRPSTPVSRVVRLGRFTSGDLDVLLVPNDPEILRDLVAAAMVIAGDQTVETRLRIRAQDLVGLIRRATTETAQDTASACAVDDPKVTAADLARARREVGSPKLSVERPEGLLYIAYGLGVDSTAILVGLAQLVAEGHEEFRPDYIVFADTGVERSATYDYIDVLDPWLDKVGFPRVQVVAYATEFASKSFGSSRTLEQQVILTQQLPSYSATKTQKSTCSMLWKQQAQQKWLEVASGLYEHIGGRSYRPKLGLKIVKAIGYDAEEGDRAEHGDTFRVEDDKRLVKQGRENPFSYWFPLMDWNWDRARCIAEIEAAIGVVPVKSACTFCGAARKSEIATLTKDELLRTLLVEQLALNGWHAETYAVNKNKGLGIDFSWTEFALEEGLISRREHAALMRKVFELAALPQDRGEINLADHPVIRRLPAFKDVRGLRGRPGTWDRYDEIPDDKKARA